MDWVWAVEGFEGWGGGVREGKRVADVGVDRGDLCMGRCRLGGGMVVGMGVLGGLEL